MARNLLTKEIVRNIIRRTWSRHQSDWEEMCAELEDEVTVDDIYECVCDAHRYRQFCDEEWIAEAFGKLAPNEVIHEHIEEMYPEYESTDGRYGE